MLRLVRRRCTENRAVTSANARAVYEPLCPFSGPSPGYRRRGSSEKGSRYTCTNKTNSFITSLLGEFSSTLPKLKGQERKCAKVLVDQEISHWESRLYWKILSLIKERTLGRCRHHPGMALRWQRSPPFSNSQQWKRPGRQVAMRGLGLSIGELVNFS